MKRLTTVRIARDADMVRIRQVGQELTGAVGFDSFGQTRTATAWLELARNALQHGGGGRMVFGMKDIGGRVAVLAVASDQGPGIERVEDLLAGRRRASAHGGLGLGLTGVHRMADHFDIKTGPEGTVIEAGFLTDLPAEKLVEYLRKATDSLGVLDDLDPAAALAQQNDELLKALAERDLLIAEIHHRTRNNLALVASLVRLARASAGHDETKHVLRELEGRISAIVRVHQQLQHAETSGQLPLLPLLREVVDQARQAFSTAELRLSATVTGDELTVGSGAAVAVGLIVGELMTNAMKHAFTGRQEGKIVVSVDGSEEGYVALEVADDGNGLPSGLDRPERSTSLGWRMIRTMAEKYGGSVTTEGSSGLRVMIRFDADLLASS